MSQPQGVFSDGLLRDTQVIRQTNTALAMTTPRYFRAYAESLDDQIGVCFYEVVNERVTRQLWQFGSESFWAYFGRSKDTEYAFTDQPEWLDGEGAIDLIECDRKTFDLAWTDSGGPTVVPVAYENEQYALYVEEDSEDTISGTLHLDETERSLLRRRTESETEWYLDDDGERLEPDELFAASPWSIAGADRKLLCRTIDLVTGKATFNTPSGYGGEMFRWVREQNKGV